MVIKTLDDLVTAIIEEAEQFDWEIQHDAPDSAYLDGFQSSKAEENAKYNIKKLIEDYISKNCIVISRGFHDVDEFYKDDEDEQV